MNTVALALRQTKYELLAFRRNPAAVFFTFVFPLMFLVIFNVVFGSQEIEVEGGEIDTSTFYVPGIVGLSVISACYTNIAISISFARDRGLLKRIQGTPLPSVAFFAGKILQATIVSVILVILVLAVGVIAVLPAALADTALGDPARIAIGILRWPALALAMVVALGLLYRLAPDRDDAKWRWVGLGSVVATVLWLVGSGLFSLYAANFGKYEDTYGALGGVVVVMLWLFLTAYVIVLGAELNAEAERQTAKDTTTGRHRPLGARDAEAADTLGPTAEQVKAGVPASADVSASGSATTSGRT